MSYSIREIGENIKNSPLFEGSVEYSVPLSDLTTMRVGGPAEIFIRPQSELSAAVAVSICKKLGVKVFILGGGSNVVVNDEGFSGAVIASRSMSGISLVPKVLDEYSTEDYPNAKEAVTVELTVLAGTQIQELNQWCERYGITGLETFAGLPGTVGGATYMNARCYETDFSSTIKAVKYIDIDAIPQRIESMSTYDINPDSFIKTYTMTEGSQDWGYKKSPFQKTRRFITEVIMELKALDPYICGGQTANPAIQDYIKQKNQARIQDRQDKGQFKAPSAGSVFKNNHSYGKPSGAIIDEVGLKGTKIGGAQVAPWHGNFVINTGTATAADIRQLVAFIREKVHENTGFNLEPEIIFV
ncbi:MAG: UDP-N-acetylmuramate dehydrogenase [Treponema sp.]|nr:UDP-N-acetylmuramate dehydrogenase [Treponema sp.]